MKISKRILKSIDDYCNKHYIYDYTIKDFKIITNKRFIVKIEYIGVDDIKRIEVVEFLNIDGFQAYQVKYVDILYKVSKSDVITSDNTKNKKGVIIMSRKPKKEGTTHIFLDESAIHYARVKGKQKSFIVTNIRKELLNINEPKYGYYVDLFDPNTGEYKKSVSMDKVEIEFNKGVPSTTIPVKKSKMKNKTTKKSSAKLTTKKAKNTTGNTSNKITKRDRVINYVTEKKITKYSPDIVKEVANKVGVTVRYARDLLKLHLKK